MENEKFDLDAFRAQPLPTESEIIANWQGDIEKPIVSVLCNTFNQATYIEDAFRGFLIQKTDFVFEVIVHDDASTDRTSDIVREYAKRYPQIFKPVIQTENQYSQGKKPTLLSSAHAKGEYFALCEGDDFWLDESKLQKQFECLKDNPKVGLCFHSAITINCKTNEQLLSGEYGEKDLLINLKDIIAKSHGQIMTASTFCKKEVILKFSEFVESRPWLTVGDIYIHFFGAQNSGAFYLHETMSVYRIFAVGSWTSTSNELKQLRHVRARVRSYNELNIITDGRYKKYFHSENRKWIKIFILNRTFSNVNKTLLLKENTQYFNDFECSLLHYISKFKFIFFAYKIMLKCLRYLKNLKFNRAV
ncbi:glycosyltransferase [Pseudoalteromonas sp. SR43-6]|uniref:glycosyltransferase family 2 protein n=1 Tax=unclassified Pseudoalteromonas TaxID=194690 RepID=UPI0015FD5918|nr:MULTISPECIES: glycosyltransferase [unclassified Pseudoalteromonas]MBB1290176.1 glycosyltransferase [Pseudoalteromonas sp. SR41-5]MBB1373825.1 glycosyltransferase [Pseudoalteromonas sp. SR43-6]MBB1412876.1 glycosyltransferase [Pseudoalteromonas sp. SG43-8]